MADDPNLNTNPVSSTDPSNSNPSVVQTPQNPVSSPAKETQPYYSEQNKPTEQVVNLSEKEPEIRPEVESAGVKVISDKIKLDQVQREAGLTEAKESTPVSVNGTKVTLPLKPEQAKIDAKGRPDSSITWLANLVILTIKKLGGSAKGETKSNA